MSATTTAALPRVTSQALLTAVLAKAYCDAKYGSLVEAKRVRSSSASASTLEGRRAGNGRGRARLPKCGSMAVDLLDGEAGLTRRGCCENNAPPPVCRAAGWLGLVGGRRVPVTSRVSPLSRRIPCGRKK